MTSSGIWVDCDFGFDDLWALLLLRQLDIEVAGVSLVYGNTPLDQVCRNAAGAKELFDLPWSVYVGAAAPLRRKVQSAQRILGSYGMRTRGGRLPDARLQTAGYSASEAFARWLDTPGPHRVLALGPLTNIALFCNRDKADGIDRITWMGGSAGRGNHTHWAEFNAVCDPDALAKVAASGVALDVIDLELCRKVQFSQLPSRSYTRSSSAQSVLGDLLGGYLDIALQRGRAGMNIYDPIAVLSLAEAVAIEYQAVDMTVELDHSERAGRTVFSVNCTSSVRLASDIEHIRARELCLRAIDLRASGFEGHT